MKVVLQQNLPITEGNITSGSLDSNEIGEAGGGEKKKLLSNTNTDI